MTSLAGAVVDFWLFCFAFFPAQQPVTVSRRPWFRLGISVFRRLCCVSFSKKVMGGFSVPSAAWLADADAVFGRFLWDNRDLIFGGAEISSLFVEKLFWKGLWISHDKLVMTSAFTSKGSSEDNRTSNVRNVSTTLLFLGLKLANWEPIRKTCLICTAMFSKNTLCFFRLERL